MKPGSPAWEAHMAQLEAEATAYWDAFEPCGAQDPVTGFVCSKGHLCNRCYAQTVGLDGGKAEVGLAMLAAEASSTEEVGRARFLSVNGLGQMVPSQRLPPGDETALYVRADLWRLALTDLAHRIGQERARFSTAYFQGLEAGKKER